MSQIYRTVFYFILISLLMPGSLIAEYWQQYVEYEMDIFLDEDKKILEANSNLLYVNHSPDALDQVLMQLYPNAFNAGTIAEEVWAFYEDSFPADKGWTGIKINRVKSDSVDFEFEIRDDTILDIKLAHLLQPGDSIQFSLDWTSLIHPHIDRSGWKKRQFDFAQWYPKFVVYDENGWHDDPFGDWGEFYGEFGNFRVNFDVPLDMIVASSGVVVDGDPGWDAVTVDTSLAWEKWLIDFKVERAELLAGQDIFARRQVSFVAENVHDFAWVCSPDFVYEHSSWDGIDVHSIFSTDVGAVWTKDVARHGAAALEWLSEKFGYYPWPQMTVVKALLGGGMEYPMLVMDASESEGLILHEIGHNWFFGIFGNDELDDAWLDEGFTSFQTNWYIETVYPDNGYSRSRKRITEFEENNLPRQMYWEADFKSVLRYMTSAHNQPIATHSFDYSDYTSYRSNVYDKASIMLQSLKLYLGEEKFLAGMQLYYDRWALKHVNEDRFIKAMEDGSGASLDWFFDQWLHTTNYVDYELVDWTVEPIDQGHYKTRVEIYNKGGMYVPMSATVYGSSGESSSAMPDDFVHRKSAYIDVESNFHPKRVVLDAENVFFDVDRRNNDSKSHNSFRYNYKGWDAYPDAENLYLWNPQFGFNDEAGLGVGLNIKRVYRNTGNFIAFEGDHNFTSGNPDVSIAFKHNQLDLPFNARWSGSVGSWRSMGFAELDYEMSWAKRFWVNPINYLTLHADFTDAQYSDIGIPGQSSFSRFKVLYDYQNTVLAGNLGISAFTSYSPSGLGLYGQDFSQFSFLVNWARNFSYLNFNNRTNYFAHYGNTPDMVKSRVGTVNARQAYLSRIASSLHQSSGIDMIGPHYYLQGGGRMRAYTDTLNSSAKFIWSNNTDIKFRTSQYGVESLDFGAFIDIGQFSDDAENWTGLADFGFSLTYRPYWKRNSWLSTIIRPFKVKIEIPITRYENDEWVNAASQNLWIFSISI